MDKIMVKTVANFSGYEIDALFAVLNTNTVFNAVRETLCSDEEIRIFDKFVTMLNGADGLNVEATISEEELAYRQSMWLK